MHNLKVLKVLEAPLGLFLIGFPKAVIIESLNIKLQNASVSKNDKANYKNIF